LDLGKAADHFLTVAVSSLAFLSSSLSLLRVAVAVAGLCGDGGFAAVFIANDYDGVKQKRQQQ
jgi:hypothetical protein